MTEQERWHCYRCGMSFRIGRPFKCNSEWMNCPDCKLKFFAGTPQETHPAVVVWVDAPP